MILVSSLNLKVFDALAAGAVDFVRKPDGTESKQSFLDSLAQKIVVASCAKVRRRAAVSPAAPSLSSVLSRRASGGVRIWIAPSSAWALPQGAQKPPWKS